MLLSCNVTSEGVAELMIEEIVACEKHGPGKPVQVLSGVATDTPVSDG
ncbi:MAG: hypothetical protein JSW48_17300 [Betaproteobacteria bacterium]|jgi:hypothetical protein|nr:MAG: hypothetical protein JSW48_17300 [Betaproteobacteria bacterium]